jgi:hypothetical protein
MAQRCPRCDNKPAMIFGINAMQGLRVIYDHQAKRFWFD